MADPALATPDDMGRCPARGSAGGRDVNPTPATLDDVCRLLAQVRDRLDAQARPPAELLTRDDVAALLAVGVSTFDRQRATGKVGPRPADLAGLKWHRPEVLAWLANRDVQGELYDADSWPAVWASLQPRGKGR